MSFETTWLVHNRVLYVRIYATQTYAEVQHMAVVTRALCEQGDNPVYIISDTRELLRTQFSMQDVVEMFRGAPPPINRVRWSLYVSLNPVNRFLFSIVSQLTSGKHRAFVSMDEAVAFLQRMDFDLPSIPMPENNCEGLTVIEAEN